MRFESSQKWSEKDGLLIESYGKFLTIGMRVRPVANGYKLINNNDNNH